MEIFNGRYCVYIHTNKENGKMYIGITCQKPEERWRKGKGYKGCEQFYRAIKKYGWDGFEHEIIASKLTKEEAENMERMLIKYFNTQDSDFGYNISEGGNAPQQTEETKKKISETHMGPLNPMYGRKHTEEEIENQRQHSSGVNNPRYGADVTDETRKRISEALMGRHLSEEHKAKIAAITSKRFKGRPKPKGAGKPAKRILCVETGEVFDSIAEAAKVKGIKNKNRISAAAKGTADTVGGFHWKYYEQSDL